MFQRLQPPVVELAVLQGSENWSHPISSIGLGRRTTSTLAQVAHPLSPNTTHTTATKTQTRIHFPHVPPELVKPKPNPVTHSPPTPLPPPRAKHIHMSYTPPTPLTTFISSTSPALNHVYHPYTHSPQPHLPRTPHQHCRHNSTRTIIRSPNHHHHN